MAARAAAASSCVCDRVNCRMSGNGNMMHRLCWCTTCHTNPSLAYELAANKPKLPPAAASAAASSSSSRGEMDLDRELDAAIERARKASLETFEREAKAMRARVRDRQQREDDERVDLTESQDEDKPVASLRPATASSASSACVCDRVGCARKGHNGSMHVQCYCTACHTNPILADDLEKNRLAALRAGTTEPAGLEEFLAEIYHRVLLHGNGTIVQTYIGLYRDRFDDKDTIWRVINDAGLIRHSLGRASYSPPSPSYPPTSPSYIPTSPSYSPTSPSYKDPIPVAAPPAMPALVLDAPPAAAASSSASEVKVAVELTPRQRDIKMLSIQLREARALVDRSMGRRKRTFERQVEELATRHAELMAQEYPVPVAAAAAAPSAEVPFVADGHVVGAPKMGFKVTGHLADGTPKTVRCTKGLVTRWLQYYLNDDKDTYVAPEWVKDQDPTWTCLNEGKPWACTHTECDAIAQTRFCETHRDGWWTLKDITGDWNTDHMFLGYRLDDNGVQWLCKNFADRLVQFSLKLVETKQARKRKREAPAQVAQLKRELSEARKAPVANGILCLTCCEAPPTVVFMPCTHQLMCKACSDKLADLAWQRGMPDTCPKCRAVIRQRVVPRVDGL